MMKKIISSIPNGLTCCNLLSGVLACLAAFQGPAVTGPLSLSGFQLAWLLITAAAAFDFFDGFAARALHAYSPLGKELDSLADLVSFGVAPGILLYNVADYLSAPAWLPFFALLIPVCGALRLAKFNIDTRQTTSFIGLPIPSNAIFWIGYTAWLLHAPAPLHGSHLILTIILIPAVSLLMVSELPMFSLKFHSFRPADNKLRLTLMVTTIILLAVFKVAGATLAIAAYILLSIFDNTTRRSE